MGALLFVRVVIADFIHYQPDARSFGEAFTIWVDCTKTQPNV
jgi:hypothetical protein